MSVTWSVCRGCILGKSILATLVCLSLLPTQKAGSSFFNSTVYCVNKRLTTYDITTKNYAADEKEHGEMRTGSTSRRRTEILLSSLAENVINNFLQHLIHYNVMYLPACSQSVFKRFGENGAAYHCHVSMYCWLLLLMVDLRTT